MKRNTQTVYFIAHAAAIAAIYTVLTMVCMPVAFGPVQFRISAAPLDVVFGSLATLIGACGSYLLRGHKYLVCIPPIVSNTIIIPWVLRYAYGSEDLIPVAMVTVGIGELLAIGVLGNVLLSVLERYNSLLFKKDTVL